MNAHPQAYALQLKANDAQSYLQGLARKLKVGASGGEEYFAQRMNLTAEQLLERGLMQREIAEFVPEVTRPITGLMKEVIYLVDLLQDRDQEHEHERNRVFGEPVRIDTSSGMPFYDLPAQLRARKKSRKHSSFKEIGQELATIYSEDVTPGEEILAQARNVRRAALEKNFTETMQLDLLPGYDSLEARLVGLNTEDAQEQWVIEWTRCNSYNSLPVQYTLLVEAQPGNGDLVPTPQGISVSPDLAKTLEISSLETACWYHLQEIDKKHPLIRPIIFAKTTIGPYDTASRTRKVRGVTRFPPVQEILQENPQAGFLHISNQYAISPDTVHQEDGESARFVQQVRRSDFNDEIIIAPTRFSQNLQSRVGGSNLQVWEDGGIA